MLKVYKSPVCKGRDLLLCEYSVFWNKVRVLKLQKEVFEVVEGGEIEIFWSEFIKCVQNLVEIDG